MLGSGLAPPPEDCQDRRAQQAGSACCSPAPSPASGSPDKLREFCSSAVLGHVLGTGYVDSCPYSHTKRQFSIDYSAKESREYNSF